jgi:hypothetical protein
MAGHLTNGAGGRVHSNRQFSGPATSISTSAARRSAGAPPQGSAGIGLHAIDPETGPG